MLADFRAEALRLLSEGLTPEQAAERLDHRRLGDFYLRAPDYWYPLDDAAKIYPMSMTDGWMSVFRLSAWLDAPVAPELLQAALHFVLPRFPLFATRVRRGVFWHYIDAAKRRFEVRPETEPPCAPMDIAAGDAQAFRVVYFGERVSVEFFHILTDGTGGLAFLSALLTEYLRLQGLSEGVGGPAEADTRGEECENAFERFAPGCAAGGGFSEGPAVQLGGKLARQRPAARLAYGFLSERAFTSTLSNLGRAALPEELARHVRKLGFVLGTGEQCRASCAMVTFGGTALLSITKLTEDPAFEKWLCTLFERAGVPFELEGSVLYGA